MSVEREEFWLVEEFLDGRKAKLASGNYVALTRADSDEYHKAVIEAEIAAETIATIVNKTNSCALFPSVDVIAGENEDTFDFRRYVN
jgi:hypothetical protein